MAGTRCKKTPLAANFIFQEGPCFDPTTLRPSSATMKMARSEWSDANTGSYSDGMQKVVIFLPGETEAAAATNLVRNLWGPTLDDDTTMNKVYNDCLGQAGWASLSMHDGSSFLPSSTEVIVSNRFLIPRGCVVHSVTALGLPFKHPDEVPLFMDKYCEYMERILENQQAAGGNRRDLVLYVCLDKANR